MLAAELGVLGHARAAVEHDELAVLAADLHGLADQRERHRVAVGVDADEPVVGDDPRQRGLEAEARLAAVGSSAARSWAKRSIGRSCVVPWIRTSAMVVIHSASCSCRWTSSTNSRPGRKLPLKYFTPDSTLPLVCARYGRQSRGSKPQYSAKARKVGFQMMRPCSVPWHTVRGRS